MLYFSCKNLIWSEGKISEGECGLLTDKVFEREQFIELYTDDGRRIKGNDYLIIIILVYVWHVP